MKSKKILHKLIILLKEKRVSLRVFKKLMLRILSSKFGEKFKNEYIGFCSVGEEQFAFYDPTLNFLPYEIAGKKFEPGVTSLIKSLLTDNSVFLDIGSFYGFYACYVSSLNKNCTVYIFEPARECIDKIKRNMELNNVRGKLFDIALSDEILMVPFANKSMKVKKGEDHYMVSAIPYDNLRHKLNIRADIAKIDVEGAEGSVLYGMKEALAKDLVHIFCEIHPEHMLQDYT